MGWVGSLESKLRAQSRSLHPRCWLSGPSAQIQSVQRGLGAGGAGGTSPRPKLCRSPPPSITPRRRTRRPTPALGAERPRALKGPRARDVMQRGSNELAGRGTSFGAAYLALPWHGSKPACQPSCLGAKGKEQPFRGTTCASPSAPRCCCFIHRPLPPAPRSDPSSPG